MRKYVVLRHVNLLKLKPRHNLQCQNTSHSIVFHINQDTIKSIVWGTNTQENSPGFSPGACWRISMLFWVIPPYPPAGSLGQECLPLVAPQSPSEPLGTTFSQFFSNVFLTWFLEAFLFPESFKNRSKTEPTIAFLTTLRRFVFWAGVGKAKNEKISVSSTPYAHIRGSKGSKIHSKNHQKTFQNVKKG